MIGRSLGPYDLAKLGEGGMGEVYKARDTRLERTVAIKVLPAALGADPEFRERFQREAKSISALNHPNICTLFDVGRAPASQSGPEIDFLVMEYLEGETLAARLERGPMPLPDALAIAVEIAMALEAAHKQSIVHRDLKPGNVMLMPRRGSAQAEVKLLDFGLAKVATPGALSGSVLTAMPTATAPFGGAQGGPLTAHGTILGTFQYMAPEQIEGEDADARTDIFAFGAVLFEMLAGRKAFAGKSQASLLGAILKDDVPPVSQVQPLATPALDYLVRTCLAKDPEARFQSAHDVLLQLRWIKDGGSAAGIAAPVIAHRKRRDWLMTGALAAVAALAAAAAAWWLKPAPVEPHVVVRFQQALGEGQNFTRFGRRVVAISPDGTKVVYVANQQLYLRALDQLEAQPIRGSNEDPIEPVFSPDGLWIAYVVAQSTTLTASIGASGFTLKKIPVGGGVPLTLGQVGVPFGMSWRKGQILLGVNGPTSGVQAVPDTGGETTMLVKLDGTKEGVTHPFWLDDTHLMFVQAAVPNVSDEGKIVVQEMPAGERTVVLTGGSDPHVLPTGHLVYIRNSTLLAVRFDPRSRQIAGTPAPVLEGVSEGSPTWTGQFAVSDNGTLIFRPGALTGPSIRRNLLWVDRQGREQPIAAPARPYQYARVSPDGTKISMNASDEESDIWIYDLKKENLARLTFGPASEAYAPWMPDGRSVIYSSGEASTTSVRDLFLKAVDGTGSPRAITQNKSAGAPSSISPDGKYVVIRTGLANEANDLLIAAIDGSSPPRPLLADPKFNERNGEISPSGKWIAYDSNESGRLQVFVRPFPNVDGGRWQVSSDGGIYPLWSRSSNELFYVTSNSSQLTLMRVSVEPGSGFSFGKPEKLFDVSQYYSTTGRSIDISPDGKRFLMIKAVGTSDPAARPMLTVVTNWFEEVRARVPGR